MERETQWNLSYPDTNGADESVIVSEVSSFQRLKELYTLGVGKSVLYSCLERCKSGIYTWGGKGVMFREVSSVQRLKCTCKSGTWGGKRCPVYIIIEVSSVQGCPHRERFHYT